MDEATLHRATTPPELLVVSEVAVLLRCSKSDVYRMIRRGELPSFQLGVGRRSRGRKIRVARSDVIEFLAARRRA